MTFTSDSLLAERYQLQQRLGNTAIGRQTWLAIDVLSLAVDASDTHVGGLLQQKAARGLQPLAFFSRKLTPQDVKYSTFDRALLVAFEAIRHFRFLLEGQQFQLLKDHKPLVAAMVWVSPPWSARQQRHLSYISEFTTDLFHTLGVNNVVVDTLSRPLVTATVPAAP